MKIVWSWLMELVRLDREVDAEEGARALTGAGLEVEGMEEIGAGFSGVVIAEVVGVERHPDADRLTLVDVIDRPGGSPTRVVCGAPNVPAPGGRVLWARPGARLPSMEIGVRAVKGVESAGMLCAEDELGLGDDHAGIIVLGDADRDAPLGADPATALRLRDHVLEVNAPANRPDALGHLGIARELAAIVGGRLAPPPAALDALTDSGVDCARLAEVEIADPDGCPRYVARVIDGVTVAPSPTWMQRRLRAVGVRPISNLVDITNYVMFELGQPLHAFDWGRLAGGAGRARIEVRRARAGERMKTLDDVDRALDAGDLLICDASRPVALAGVMGGLDTEVTGDTRRVLLEAAGFDPRSVRRTARRLGLHSESSYRFERHVDTNTTDLASRRAAWLLASLGGGKIAAGSVDAHPRPAGPRTVGLRVSRTRALTGVDLDAATIAGTLRRLGLEVAPSGDDGFSVTCPSFRTDLEREVDLIEEVLRLHGFANVPATMPHTEVPPRRPRDPRRGLARTALLGAGLSEAITFGFTSPQRIAALRLPDSDPRSRPLALRNPMTIEQSVMRSSLLPNLLAAVARNLAYGIADVRLFEVGSTFIARGPGELPDEPLMVAGVITGARPGWLEQHPAAVDFFDLKGALDRLVGALLGDAGAARWVAVGDVPYLHPGVAAALELADGTRLGVAGEVHPETRRLLDVAPTCFAFELDLGRVPVPAPAQMAPIPRHPAVTRDISFLIDADIPAARVADAIARAGAGEQLVESVAVVEDFRDPAHVPAGRKGMLWTISYRAADRTLTDAEVDRAHEAIVSRLLAELGGQRR